jgi:hypothetical protein
LWVSADLDVHSTGSADRHGVAGLEVGRTVAVAAILHGVLHPARRCSLTPEGSRRPPQAAATRGQTGTGFGPRPFQGAAQPAETSAVVRSWPSVSLTRASERPPYLSGFTFVRVTRVPGARISRRLAVASGPPASPCSRALHPSSRISWLCAQRSFHSRSTLTTKLSPRRRETTCISDRQI